MDNNMENLVTALPQLESLELGDVCELNSCNTTVTSLLSISLHCLDLTILEVHFNTQTIVSDMRRLLDGGTGRDRAKCQLRNLDVGWLPLEVDGEDIETVAMGFKVIFPCLTGFECWDDSWRRLEAKLGD